jgi:hypothetical protein
MLKPLCVQPFIAKTTTPSFNLISAMSTPSLAAPISLTPNGKSRSSNGAARFPPTSKATKLPNSRKSYRKTNIVWPRNPFQTTSSPKRFFL